MLDASFADSGKETGKKLRKGQSVKGTVVQIGKDAVFVDVGTRSEGQIDRWELQDRDGNLTVSVGDPIKATVEVGGDRPKLVVALGRGGVDVAALELAAESGTPVEGTFTKAVKAGIEVDLAGTRAFCPASQVDTGYTADLSVWEGQRYQFKVIEVREGGRSVVVSRKAVLADERAAASAEIRAGLEVGAEMDGTVKTIQAYGAFVDLGGVEGLVHISELGHGRVGSVNDVVSVGEKVRVRVIGLEGDRIKLSMRQVGVPAGGGGGESKADKILDGKVVKVESFGVFVQTEAGTGLVPTKELDLPPGAAPSRSYPVDKEVRVVVLGQDPGGKLRLSIRRVEDAEARAAYREFRGEQKKKSGGKGSMGSFGELLAGKLGDLGNAVPDQKASDASAKPAKPKGKRRRM